jgi:hypothetical protein
MEDVRSQLLCNNPDSNTDQVLFTFSEKEVNENIIYFFRSFRENLSAYKSLTFFMYYLNEKSSAPSAPLR